MTATLPTNKEELRRRLREYNTEIKTANTCGKCAKQGNADLCPFHGDPTQTGYYCAFFTPAKMRRKPLAVAHA